jgi:hypothetical protein
MDATFASKKSAILDMTMHSSLSPKKRHSPTSDDYDDDGVVTYDFTRNRKLAR